jgi:hypothetical protein
MKKKTLKLDNFKRSFDKRFGVYLTVRARNALRKYEVNTIKDFMDLTPNDILKWKNVGVYTAVEIEKAQKEILEKNPKMSERIICPVCNKDLTEALKLLGASFKVHMDVHINENALNIFNYVLNNIPSLPDELKDMVRKHISNKVLLEEYQRVFGE